MRFGVVMSFAVEGLLDLFAFLQLLEQVVLWVYHEAEVAIARVDPGMVAGNTQVFQDGLWGLILPL